MITVSVADSVNHIQQHLFRCRGALTEHILINKLSGARCVMGSPFTSHESHPLQVQQLSKPGAFRGCGSLVQMALGVEGGGEILCGGSGFPWLMGSSALELGNSCISLLWI